MNAEDRKWIKIGSSMLATFAIGLAMLAIIFRSSADEQQERAMHQMAWCHDLGGTYSNKIHEKEHNGAPRFDGDQGTCDVPPGWSLPEDCYTTENSAPAGVPIDVNWYAYYLLGKGGAGAGGLDEYEHCAEFPVVRPSHTSLWVGPKSAGSWAPTRPRAAP